MSASVTVRAAAKINLRLHVGPVRNGYHDLVTVFHAVGLFDEVTVAPADRLRVELDAGPGIAADTVPLGADNLAAKAVHALAAVLGERPTVRIHIAKSIPVAGGLAGGSADAAAALLACNHLWGAPLSRDRLLEIAASLGSDVPFSLTGQTAVGEGRGEILTPVPVSGQYHWLLACTTTGLSTPTVFAELDRIRGEHAVREGSVREMLDALAAGDVTAVAKLLVNDLQEPALALRPELKRTLDCGLEGGALGGVLSGSGPTCVFLVRDRAHATELGATLMAAGACTSAVYAAGPADGASVVTAAGGSR